MRAGKTHVEAWRRESISLKHFEPIYGRENPERAETWIAKSLAFADSKEYNDLYLDKKVDIEQSHLSSKLSYHTMKVHALCNVLS